MGFGAFFKKVAPWLATAAEVIPGGGPVVGIVKGIAAATGHSDLQVDGTVDSISNAVAAMSGNAEAMAQLKKQDQDYALQMQSLGFKQVTDLEALAEKDRESARQMQTANKSWIPGFLAISVTIGFFTLLILMLAGKVTSQDNPATLLLLGSLGTSWGGIVTFYFGSSAGSDRKTELLAQQQKK